jgi:hypothetical protein
VEKDRFRRTFDGERDRTGGDLSTDFFLLPLRSSAGSGFWLLPRLSRGPSTRPLPLLSLLPLLSGLLSLLPLLTLSASFSGSRRISLFFSRSRSPFLPLSLLESLLPRLGSLSACALRKRFVRGEGEREAEGELLRRPNFFSSCALLRRLERGEGERDRERERAGADLEGELE